VAVPQAETETAAGPTLTRTADDREMPTITRTAASPTPKHS
jgi:hypothetical protein